MFGRVITGGGVYPTPVLLEGAIVTRRSRRTSCCAGVGSSPPVASLLP